MATKLTKLTDSSVLPNGVDILGPVARADGGFEGNIPQEWFQIDPPIRKKTIFGRPLRSLKNRQGARVSITNCGRRGRLASASKCPKCGSECLEDGY